MVRHICDIGRGRYIFDRSTLTSFMEEARNQPTPGDHSGFTEVAHRANGPDDDEMLGIFEEVMALYRDYTRFQSVDLLVKLKRRLEQISIRYHSHVLAAEVLNINSCLPYEHRIPTHRTNPTASETGDLPAAPDKKGPAAGTSLTGEPAVAGGGTVLA